MAKKKISSEDFLNLLDDQEAAPTKRTFEPQKKKSKKDKIRLKFGKHQLSPVQDELLRLVLAKTPLVSRYAKPDKIQDFADRLDQSLSEVKTTFQRVRTKLTRGIL